MSELPTLRLKGSDGEYEVTPENGVLYRHLGNKAIYDYILMVTEEHDETREGYPVFIRGLLDDGDIDQVTHFMITRGFESHLNIKKPNSTVVTAYEGILKKQTEDLEDFVIPTDWENEITD